MLINYQDQVLTEPEFRAAFPNVSLPTELTPEVVAEMGGEVHVVPIALSARLVLKLGEVNAGYEAAIAAITAGYPASERLTWEIQRGEALAWQQDNDAPTPWLDTAAAARGLPRLDYIQRTLVKIGLFAQATAYLTGRRQFFEDQCKSAQSAEAMAAIAIDFSLPGAPA